MLKTIPETPQQNGVAERMNRTLNKRAKSMRIHAGLPKAFWADSVSTAAYLINRGLSNPMGFKIPKEEWRGKEITLSHLKMIWGIISGMIGIERSSEGEMSHLIKKPPEKEKEKVEQEDITDKDLVGSSGSSGDRTSEETVPVTPEVRRSNRTIRPPQRYSPSANYLLLTDDGEPQCYDEALQMDDSAQWGKKALQNKWVFTIKEEHDGRKRYKARLVVKGFLQKRGIDYNEIFSPVVKMTTIRLVLSIVIAEDLHLEQLDVKTTFLYSDLDEDIYMVQPEGYQIAGKENLVCKLTKSLYGLKQASMQWYLKFDTFMSRSGYKKCAMDPCFYWRHFGSSYIILLLYVYGMLVAGFDMEEINRLKEQLYEEFEMKDLSASKQILGMSISRNRAEGSLILSQEKYIRKVLERFSM
ncbi:Retrovirus-related Pol polyprotein from transposon TNT 1-94-like protein [Drosera capensis]